MNIGFVLVLNVMNIVCVTSGFTHLPYVEKIGAMICYSIKSIQKRFKLR